MIYYQKDNQLFYRLEAQEHTVTEVFVSSNQCRLMITINEQIYQDTVNRINSMGFDESSEAQFNSALSAAKASIVPA